MPFIIVLPEIIFLMLCTDWKCQLFYMVELYMIRGRFNVKQHLTDQTQYMAVVFHIPTYTWELWSLSTLVWIEIWGRHSNSEPRVKQPSLGYNAAVFTHYPITAVLLQILLPLLKKHQLQSRCGITKTRNKVPWFKVRVKQSVNFIQGVKVGCPLTFNVVWVFELFSVGCAGLLLMDTPRSDGLNKQF